MSEDEKVSTYCCTEHRSSLQRRTHTQNQLTDLLDTSYPPDLHLHPSCPHTAVCKSIVSTVGLDTETDTGELKVRCTQYGEVV